VCVPKVEQGETIKGKQSQIGETKKGGRKSISRIIRATSLGVTKSVERAETGARQRSHDNRTSQNDGGKEIQTKMCGVPKDHSERGGWGDQTVKRKAETGK